MSLQVRNPSTGLLERVAGFNDTDIALSPTSVNPVANKTIYAALTQKINKTVDDLVNYYKKSETYSQAEVRALIGAINTLTIEVVSTLPTQDISTTTIYFVGPTSGKYDEYVYVNNAWVKIGDTEIDLTDYVTSTQLTTILQDYYTKVAVDALLDNYYTKTDVNNLLDDKQDALTFDTTPTAGSNNPVTSGGVYNAIQNGGISQHYFLGTGMYDRPYLPRTITINKTGHNALIVTPHMGSYTGYQSNYTPAVFDISTQLYQAGTNLYAIFPSYDETTHTVLWYQTNFADVTAVTQDTFTLSTESAPTGYPWFHIHVI